MLLQHENLHIRHVSNGALVASVLVESLVTSIALSRNDEFVALGTAGKALVYNTANLQLLCCHELPPIGDLTSKCQRVWFSADSEKVIAATRNTKGDVYTYVGDCKSPTTNYNIPYINIPTVSHSVFVSYIYYIVLDPVFDILTFQRSDNFKQGLHKDFGVSSTLYDNKFGYACVTAFASAAAPALFSLQDAPKVERLDRIDLGPQIQCAASPPNASRPKFVLVNGEDYIFSVQWHPGSPWQIEKGKKRLGRGSVFKREEMMVIAMPTDDIIYTFRIQGKQRMLTTVIGDDIFTDDISKLLPI
jgi:hypothetical protein